MLPNLGVDLLRGRMLLEEMVNVCPQVPKVGVSPRQRLRVQDHPDLLERERHAIDELHQRVPRQ